MSLRNNRGIGGVEGLAPASIADFEEHGHIDNDESKTAYKQVIILNKDGDHTSLPAGLVPENHDYIALTYVSGGNGVGEIETVTYKTGGSGGTTVATLTLTYDASDNLSTVTRT